MSEQHLRAYREVVKAAFLRNDIALGPYDSNVVEAYTCGFADGVSWLGKKATELGIEIPDIELLFTDET